MSSEIALGNLIYIKSNWGNLSGTVCNEENGLYVLKPGSIGSIGDSDERIVKAVRCSLLNLKIANFVTEEEVGNAISLINTGLKFINAKTTLDEEVSVIMKARLQYLTFLQNNDHKSAEDLKDKFIYTK